MLTLLGTTAAGTVSALFVHDHVHGNDSAIAVRYTFDAGVTGDGVGCRCTS